MARSIAVNRTAAALKNEELNKTTSSSPVFKKACELAGIPATTRQARKFRHGIGKAFSAAKNAPAEAITLAPAEAPAG